MSTNGEQTIKFEEKGRGVKALIANNSISIEMKTAQAVPAIMKIIESLPDNQIQNVFNAIDSILFTSRKKEKIEKEGFNEACNFIDKKTNNRYINWFKNKGKVK